MNDKQILEILERNPQIDKDSFEEAMKGLSEIKTIRMNCSSISATPPVEPYSVNRIARYGRAAAQAASISKNRPLASPRHSS